MDNQNPQQPHAKRPGLVPEFQRAVAQKQILDARPGDADLNKNNSLAEKGGRLPGNDYSADTKLRVLARSLSQLLATRRDLIRKNSKVN